MTLANVRSSCRVSLWINIILTLTKPGLDVVNSDQVDRICIYANFNTNYMDGSLHYGWL